MESAEIRWKNIYSKVSVKVNPNNCFPEQTEMTKMRIDFECIELRPKNAEQFDWIWGNKTKDECDLYALRGELEKCLQERWAEASS